MDFFNKKKSVKDLRLPELPSAPEFPELPSESSELPLLPALPKLPAMPMVPTMERTEPIAKPFAVEIGEERKVTKPVFVKIDKFKEAMASFEIMKKRLQESSSLLEKIKETRAREEEELNQWSQELNNLKEKIALVDKKIFSNLD